MSESKPRIGIYYGTEGGNTQMIAEMLQDRFRNLGETTLKNIAKCEPSELLDHDVILLGTSTWNIGDIQYDWEERLDEIEKLNFSGVKVGLFGVGDAAGYPDTFVDGIGILWERMEPSSPKLVGAWPAAEYQFDESRGMLDDDTFLGLVLDEDNESMLTEQRVERWVRQLCQELGLSNSPSAAA